MLATDPPPIRLLRVPWDSGHRNTRMGAGPTALAEAGAASRLRERGHAVVEQVLVSETGWQAELATAFELQRLVSVAVGQARAAGQVPLLLAGNCNTTLGMLAGTDRRVGLLWLDAHGDFNTPEADTSGFLDGQGLAMVVGRCWQSLTATVPGFTPLAEHDVVLVGARDLSEAQARVLEASDVTWLRPAQARDPAAVAVALDALAARVDVLHVHVDLDVHDPSIAPANDYAAPDGLSAAEVRQVLHLAADRIPVTSAALASYDPAHDAHGRMRDTALELLEAIAGRTTSG
ncbi:arginase family protein [Blastococcus xanthinilyticus]|uniref:Arginase n=1 Tax=Blastococcus xanthinilyticus TaxID=1564164 RepID=A0A5S5CNJ0_9ACTN|nr:arginase family protein [Blastococcus xanthinilyticus]TYP84612.1 arginase [Blastococcus xanthinilyticus]